MTDIAGDIGLGALILVGVCVLLIAALTPVWLYQNRNRKS